MALLNASGTPVATTKHAVQIDLYIPSEEVAAITINWLAVLKAGAAFTLAWSSGNVPGMAQALSDFIKAVTGQ